MCGWCRYKDLQKRLSRLEKEKESAETEANWLSMDPEQARQELLQKVKSSNAEVKATQAKIEKTQKANEQARKHLEELTSSIEEHKGDNEDSQKYVVALWIAEQTDRWPACTYTASRVYLSACGGFTLLADRVQQHFPMPFFQIRAVVRAGPHHD